MISSMHYFRNADTSQTVGIINDWVSDITEDQVAKLIESRLAKDTKMVVANGMAMSAKWLYPFDPDMTFDKGLFFAPGKRR